VVSVNDRSRPVRYSIGRVLPGMEYAIVGSETGERVARGQRGMLLVRGANVFGGYMAYDGAPPFVEFEGKRWYRTGDIVVEDAAGVLTFAGRLKRFIKLGGEMISLPAIEEVLKKAYPSDEDEGPTLAVEAAGGDDNPEIVLFATLDVDRGEANARIRESGLSGLHSIRRAVRVEEIPLLGTGKTDYRALRTILEESVN
jgi:long-chain-fatty-acid--[acyl-carrier-protein] ligase